MERELSLGRLAEPPNEVENQEEYKFGLVVCEQVSGWKCITGRKVWARERNAWRLEETGDC